MADKKKQEEKVIDVKVKPADEANLEPTIASRTQPGNVAPKLTPAAEEEMRKAQQRAVNHEPVETHIEAITPDEAARRAASAEEINEFLASDAADLDPTTKKLTKKEIEAKRKAEAEEKERIEAERAARIPKPPTNDNDIPKP